MVREYTLSGSVEIICGPNRLSAHSFLEVILLLQVHGIILLGLGHVEVAHVRSITPSSIDDIIHSIDSVRSFVIRQRKTLPTHSMFHLLVEMSGILRPELRSLCSEPKDYVFSIVGLASDDLCSKLDYRRTWQDTFIMTALSLILAGNSVSVLAGLQEPSHDLRSWVPNWSVCWNSAKWTPVVPHTLYENVFSISFNASKGFRIFRETNMPILFTTTLDSPGISIGSFSHAMPLHDFIVELPGHGSLSLSAIYDERSDVMGHWFIRETPFVSAVQAWFIETIAFVSEHGRSDTSVAGSHRAWKVLLADHYWVEIIVKSSFCHGTSGWELWELASAIFAAASSMNITEGYHFVEEDISFQEAVREQLR